MGCDEARAGMSVPEQVRCVMAELLCALGAEVEGMPLQTEVLPRVLRLASDPAYLVRKVLLLLRQSWQPCSTS